MHSYSYDSCKQKKIFFFLILKKKVKNSRNYLILRKVKKRCIFG